MLGKQTAVLYDLDSTLALTQHRWGLSPLSDPGSTWERYASACGGDTPVQGVLRAMSLHWLYHENHICSMRPESARLATERWLANCGARYDVMRLADSTPVHSSYESATRWCAESKMLYIDMLRASGTEPVLFYEDQPDLARIIESERDVPVVIVNPAYASSSREWVK